MATRLATRLHLGPTAAALGCGLVALAARRPSHAALAITISVGVAGLLVPSSPERRQPAIVEGGVVVTGIIAFATVRALGHAASIPFGLWPAVASVGAAVAEEAFFRRGVYTWLTRFGIPAAVGGSAVAFAAVHAGAYGPGVLPVDLAAGLVFGWQRWATGSWRAAACTHAAANLIQMG